MLGKLSIAVITAILLFSNCSNNKKANPLREFVGKQERHIRGEYIKLASDTILFKPFDLLVYDTLAIINDNTGDAGFTIVNLNTGALMRKFAYSGNDSSEFDINALAINNAVNNRMFFSITQRNAPFKLFVYNRDSLLINQHYKPNPLYYPKGFGFSESFLLNDSILFGKFLFSKYDNKMFGIVNLASDKLTTGINVPGLIESDKPDSIELAYYKWLNVILSDRVAYRPGSTYEFASYSYGGAAINIFAIDKDFHFKEKFQKIYYLPTFSVVEGPNFTKPVPSPDSKNGFCSIAVTHDKIFALFNGPELDGSYDNVWESDNVLVYDWNGNPIEKIKLDLKCGRLAIDENNPEILYGLYGENNTKIVRYRLSEK